MHPVDPIERAERLLAEASERVWEGSGRAEDPALMTQALTAIANEALLLVLAAPRDTSVTNLTRSLLTGTTALEFGAMVFDDVGEWLATCIPAVVFDDRLLQHAEIALEFVAAGSPGTVRSFFNALDGDRQYTFRSEFPYIDARLASRALVGLERAEPIGALGTAEWLLDRVPSRRAEAASARASFDAVAANASHWRRNERERVVRPAEVLNVFVAESAAVGMALVRARSLLTAVHADQRAPQVGELGIACGHSEVAAVNAQLLVDALGEAGLGIAGRDLAVRLGVSNRPLDRSASAGPEATFESFVAAARRAPAAEADVALRNLAYVFALAGSTASAGALYRAAGYPDRAAELAGRSEPHLGRDR